MASILSSVLDEAIKHFSSQGTKGITKQSLENALKNRQVKKIEIEQSGLNDLLKDYKLTDKVPLEQIKGVLTKRKDELGILKIGDNASQYADMREQKFKIKEHPLNVSRGLETEGVIRGRYGESVLVKNLEHGVVNHFDEPNYYSHIRYTDVTNDARYVHEIQTDVHQGDRKIGAGYEEGSVITSENYIRNTIDSAVRRIQLDLTHYGILNADTGAIARQVLNLLRTPIDRLSMSRTIDSLGAQSIPEYAKTHLHETVLSRAEHFQGINISDFAAGDAEAKKPLFDKQELNWLNSTINKTLVDSANEGQNTVKFRIAPDENLMRASTVQSWYENTVAPTLQKKAKQIGADFKMTDDGYAQLTFGKDETGKLKDFKLPLYTTAGIGVLIASEANKADAAELPSKIQQARDAGVDDEQINNFLIENNKDPNVVVRSLKLKDDPNKQTQEFTDMINKTAGGL